MNNIENIPNETFDWMAAYCYDQLNPMHQQIISRVMTKEEYDEMHHATVLIKHNNQKLTKGYDVIKEELLLTFDRKYNNKTFKNTGLLLWKAAAIIMAVALPVSAYLLIKSNKQLLARQLNNNTDTVYLEKPASSNSLLVYDTIYIYKEKKGSKGDRRKEEFNRHPVDEVGVMMQHDLTVQPIERVNATPNQQKRNSVKDDSLISHFNFATM